MTAAPAVIAAAGVGLGHAILPDHWAPLAVLGRTRRYPLRKVARLSGAAGVAHVLVSIVLGAAIIVVGLQFRSSVEHAQDAIVGGLLIATGIGFLAFDLLGHGHGHPHPHPHPHGHPQPHDHAYHDEHEHDEHEHAGDDRHAHEHDDEHAHEDHDADGQPRGRSGLLAVMVPFGAAASPDLTILPVFLAASATGAAAAVGALVAFAIATIGTITLLTVLATAGGYQIRGNWLDRWGNVFTAVVLLAIGGLVLAGVL